MTNKKHEGNTKNGKGKRKHEVQKRKNGRLKLTHDNMKK